MEENIEVKDVQKTEYLDKNGLDMLWAKVKENTRNQVEVEYNRAKAKEDSLSQEIASIKPSEDKSYIQAKLTSKDQDSDNCYYDVAGQISFKSEYSDSYGGVINRINNNGIDVTFDNDPTFGSTGRLKVGKYSNYNIVMQGNGRLLHDTRDTFNEVSMQLLENADTTYANSTDGNSMLISQLGIFYTSQGYALTSNDLLTGHGDYKTIGTDIAPLENGKVPAKYLDLPQIDTSNFVSKTTIIDQSIKSGLSVSNRLHIVDSSSADINTTINGGGILVEDQGKTMQVGGGYLLFSGANGSTISLDSADSEISIFRDTIVGNKLALTITKSGIRMHDGDNNHVLTTNNSTIDITKYALKSELPITATKENLGVVKIGDGLNVADDGTISVDSKLYVTDMVSYGVEWDTTVADPACTRIGNPLLHKQLPIQSEYKGCLVKNGKVNYYLDPNDWSKKADGTPSVLDGTDGDVMVHIPKFYGKSGSNGNKRWVRITTTKIDSSWVEIPEMFVSAYKITTYMDSNTPKIASVVNTTANYRGGSNRYNYDQYLDTDIFKTDLGKPRTCIPRAAIRTRAINSGQELLCYEFYKWVFYWSCVIEYANFNLQKKFDSELTSDGYHHGGLGDGVSDISLGSWIDYNSHNPLVPCGYTNEFGNFSGEKTTFIKLDSDSIATTIHPNRWRGFENPFGDIETCLDGIVLKMDSANSESKVYTTTDSSKFGDDTSVMNIAGIEGSDRGYIVEFDLRETGEIIPQSSDNSGSATGSKYKCDYHSLDESNTNNRMLLVGGDAQHGDMNGLCSFSSHNVDYVTPYIGYRSVIRA